MIYEPVIGIEVHCELKTKTKMFSPAKVNFGDAPNTNVNIIDLAYPGILPLVNKKAIEYAIMASSVLNMKIDRDLWFDRKNYFYSDLPKGYQITQDKRPIGSNGYLIVKLPNNDQKRVNITRLHMEEDTAKQIHYNDYTLIDYNRCGTPLIEIVTDAGIRSVEEAVAYIDKLKSTLAFIGVSDAKMEEGSIRCDINISLREKGTKYFGTKVEIKNLNSLNNVALALNYEIERQSKLLDEGKTISQETRRFDELTKQTITLRSKVDAVDYKYFTEPNILPIHLEEKFINEVINSIPELPESRKQRYLNEYKLSEYDASLLLQSREFSDYFENCNALCKQPKLVANWLLVDLSSYMNKENLNITNVNIDYQRLAQLITLISENKISSKQGKEVFEIMKTSDKTPNEIVKEKNMIQVSDEGLIISLIEEVLKENPQTIEQYKSGRTNVLGFLVGQVIKKSKGQANPSIVSKILNQKLNN